MWVRYMYKAKETQHCLHSMFKKEYIDYCAPRVAIINKLLLLAFVLCYLHIQHLHKLIATIFRMFDSCKNINYGIEFKSKLLELIS